MTSRSSKSSGSSIQKRGLFNPDMRFEFGKEGRSGLISDNSLGNYLKSVFSTSSTGDVPAEIQQQFSNSTPIPKDLFVFSPAPPPADTAADPRLQAPAAAGEAGAKDDRRGLTPLADAAAAAAATPAPAVEPLTQPPQAPEQSQPQAQAQLTQPQQMLPITGDQGGDQTKHLEITEYLNMPQAQAAKAVSLAPSTFSKRWKEAAPTRKWPWRTLRKLDKQITTLLHNIPPGGQIPEDIEVTLMALLRQRQEELKPVIIRMA